MRFVEGEGCLEDGLNFDGVPPPKITFEKYNSIMNSGADSGSQNTVYNVR